MTLIVDEVALREPRLLVPGMTPLGPVRINWQNSLTKDLLRYDLFLNNKSRELVRDVVNPWVLNSSAAFTVYKENPGLNAGGVASTTNGAYDVNDGIRTKITNKITVACRFTYLISTASDFIYGNTATDAANYNWGLYLSASSFIPLFFIFSGSGANALGPNALTAGVEYILVGTYDGANIYCYIDGVSGSPTAKTGNVATTDRRMTFLDWQTFATTGTNGIINFGAVWNRVLTAAEIASLSADPYQLLTVA